VGDALFSLLEPGQCTKGERILLQCYTYTPKLTIRFRNIYRDLRGIPKQPTRMSPKTLQADITLLCPQYER